MKKLMIALAACAAVLVGSAATITVTTADDATSPVPEGSLRAAVAAAQDGDTITFDDSLKGQTINLAAQIVIDKSVSVVGPSGRITLSGGWNGSGSGSGGSGNGIFYVNASEKTVELSNLNLVNSYGVDDKSNRALYVPAVGSVTVTDCSFSNNYCTKNGGAVRLDTNAAYAKFVRCLFADNIAHSANGGAIYAEQAATAYLVVDGCSFRRNCAATAGSTNGGAGIFSTSAASTLVVANSEFSDGRTQSASGGAIKKLQGPLYVVNTTFRGNYINGDSWGPAIDGRGPTYFANCTFAGNMLGDTHDSAGSIYLGSGSKGAVNTAFAYNWRNATGSPVLEDTNNNGGLADSQMRGVVINRTKMVNTSGNKTQLTLATTLENIPVSSKIFAGYEAVSSIVYPAASGFSATTLNENVFVPSLLEDGSLARVVAIDPEGELVNGGSLVKVSADYLNCAFSEDGGTTWKALYGDAAQATELITADQRGIAYPVVEGVMQVPIGAACVPPKTINEKADELLPGEWLAEPLTGQPDDIVNIGVPFTYTYGSDIYTMANAPARANMTEDGHASVNGVSFPGWDVGNMYADGSWSADVDYYGHAGLNNDYGWIMAGAWARSASGDATFHLGSTPGCSKLVPGELYLVQIIIHNGRNETECAKTVSETTTSKTLTFGATDPSDPWYYGGTFVHLFRAPDNGEYSFTLNYPAEYAQYNAIQVRHVVRPIAPSIGSIAARTSDLSEATITLSDVDPGTNADGSSVSESYDVYAYTGSDPSVATLVIEDATDTTVEFKPEGLVSGSGYTYHVFIVNDANVTSATKTVYFVLDWTAEAMSSTGDTVETRGTTLYAYAPNASGTTPLVVNGVTFERCGYALTDADISITPALTGQWAGDLGNEGVSGDFGSMLAGAWNFSQNISSITLTLNGLTAGNIYLVQIIAHSGSDSQKGMVISAEGTTPLGLCSKDGAESKYGASIVGMFVAEGTSKNVTITYAGGMLRPLNAIQVRDLTPPAPKTIAEQAEELESGEWLAAPLTGDPSDVLTLGEPITYTAFNETYTNAYAAGAGSAVLTIGGIDFVNGNYKNVSGGGGVYGGHQQGNCGVAAPYGSMLDELYFKDDTTLTLTIGAAPGYPALEPGEDYLVQVFIHSALWEDTATVAGTDKTVRFCASNAGDEWYYGGTFVHKFTATEGSYSFAINYSNSRAIYNAIVIRKLSDPDDKKLVWNTGTYAPSAWTPADANLLRGITASLSDFEQYIETGVSQNPATLTDGEVPPGDGKSNCDYTKIFPIKKGVLTWTLEDPSNIRSFSVYSRWGDQGRSAIWLSELAVRYAMDGEWEVLGTDLSNTTEQDALYGVLAESNGGFIAEKVVQIRVTFNSGSQENNGVGYVEFEAQGVGKPAIGSAEASILGTTATISLSDVDLSGAASYDVYCAYGLHGATLSAPTKVVTGATATSTSFELTGLSLGGVYDYEVYAISSSDKQSDTFAGAFHINDPDSAVQATGAKEIIDGDDIVYVWTDTTQAGTLVFANNVTADYLLVGGGGAGGFCRGGGGGGGGVVSETERRLSRGTYTITVGAGGTPDAFAESGACFQQGRTTEGASGKSSLLSRNTTVIAEAFGGGGGGNFDSRNDITVNSGLGYEEGVRNVATGGGSTGKSTIAPAGYAGMGFAGGAACAANDDWAAGGGGGAGAVGVTPTAHNQAGAGGAGVISTITGASVCYGGGGGGGEFGNNSNKYNASGEGGAGGGGHGGSNDNADLTAGVDGLGGGGGGASGFDNLWPRCGGAQGGSGTVIVRIPLAALTEPIAPPEPVAPSATLTTTVEGADVKFVFGEIEIGTDSKCQNAESYSILLAYAPQGEALPDPQVIAADQTSATYEKEVLDLVGETTYAYQAIVSNNLGNLSAPITGTFTTGIYIETVNKLAQKLGAGEWVGVPLTGKPSDVVSYGEEVLGSDGKVRAYISGDLGTDASISFVNFRNGWNTTDLNQLFSSPYTQFGDTDVGACCYRGLMAWGWYGSNSGDDTYTLKNLVPGQSYLLQIFVHDGRGGVINNRNFGPGPGNTGNRIYFGEDTKDTAYAERGGVNWYYGGTLIHAFVATGTDYSFVINCAGDSRQINAIQLRAIPMPKGSPKIGTVTTAVEQGTAMVTLGGVAMGTDDNAQPATSYDVYAAIDDADPVKVLAGQEEAPVSFFVQNLAVGDHDIKVFIENNFGVVSPTNSATVTITTADPECYFPNGNWRSMKMTVDYSGLSTFGALNYALASSAGGNRIFTVNTIPYMEAYRDGHAGRTYYYSPYFTTDPVLNGENDCFGQEDTSGDSLNSFLRRAWTYRVGSGASGKMAIMLKQLEPGARYTVQLTAHNKASNADWCYPDGTMTAPDGVTAIQYGTVEEDTTWKYGGSLIGSFVASNTTHAFTFTYTPAKHFQLNTLQVRKTGEAPAVVPAYPTLGNTSIFIGRGSASLTLNGLNAGVTDGACDVYYALAEEGQAFGAYTRVATGVTDASYTFALTGIERGKTYIYSVYAVNPATRLASLKADGRFAVASNPGIPDEMTVEPLIRPGLVQAKFGEKVLFESNAQPPLVSNLLTQTDYAGSLDFTYGALMANHNCADASVKVVNTYTAAQWNWDTSYTVFAYEGEIYLQKGQRLVIFGRFDDGEAAVVDGVTMLAQGGNSGFNSNPATYGVVYEPAETGWYPLNAWVWDWSSGKNCMTPPSALSYNLAGVAAYNDQTLSQWKHLEDTDGMGSFLRFKDSSKKLMTLGVPATNGVDVTINAAFTGVPGAAKFVAYVSSANDGELDPLAWDEVVKIADIPAGDTAAADYTVKGLASYPFVRFAIEGEGSVSTAERCRNFRQMSCVVGFDSEGLSILIASPVFTKNSGTFNISVASLGDATSLGLDVEVSSDPVFGSTVYQGKIDDITTPGSFPVAVEDLVPGTAYYIRVKPTTAGDDAWVVSAPVETEKAGTVRINEIMASNGDAFKTKNGRSGLDWIEIYNGTDEIVDLSGWYLYDDPTKAQSKWKKIQGTCVIPVHGYGIVWCDKDYTDWDAANEAWSEIGLSTSGETVFLAKPDGTIVDTVTFGTQIKDVSYGVGKLPGSDEVTHVFFKVSTPGAENGEYGYGPMTPTVAFSVPHGYKTEPIDVAITCEADPDADIYYTLDGTQPTTASTKYTAPIHIDSTTILRAGVPQENTVLQVDSSATYIYLDDVLSMDRVETGAGVPAGFPESSAKHTMRYGMVQSVVNGADRERILRGFTNTVATLSIVIDPDCLFNADNGIYLNSRKYMNDGAAGERPMLLEQIDPVNGAANEFSVPGGLRLRGSSSLAESNPKHSLRFFFRGQYGMSKLEFPLFGEEGADSFSKVDLRCSQNYSWSMNNSEYDTFIHELFSRDSQRDLGQPYTRTRYYNLFINGQYWGLYMTQERGDKDFGETYLGGNEDYYDCIKTSSQDQWHYVTTANDGTMAAWRNLQGLAYNGFSGDYVDNYNKALGLNPDGSRNEAYPILLNPENLMAYVTIAHFVCDADGPVSVGNGGLNNLYANRYQIDGGSSMDGFWFLRHDAEHSLGVKGEGEEFGKWTQYGVDNTGLGTYEYNPLNPDWSNGYRGDPPEKDNGSVGAFGPYQLHAQLAKNPVYRRAFADYFYKHYLKEGGAMTPAVAKQRFQARMAEIDDVIVSEAARWSRDVNNPKSRETWLAACQSCLDFLDARTPVLKAAYQARGWYPTLEPPVSATASGEGSLGQVVTFTAADGAEIYITTDGTDPAESGTLSASATVTALPCTIKARAKLNDEWSPAQEVELIAPKLTGDGLIITIAGEITGTRELAPTGDVCRVILEDAEVPGGLILKPGVAYTFEPAAETVNTIGKIVGGDTSTFVLNGEGTLSMTGADTLLTVNDLIVSNGTFAIKSTGVSVKKTPIVKVMGNLFQTGGKIDIDVSVDSAVQVYGIMLASKKMEAEFSGGELVAKVGGQNKSAAIVTDKGSSDIVFKKECKITAELSGVDSRLAFSAGEIKFAKTLVGPVVVTMPQDLTGVSEAHVFKAEKTIEINGGTFDINVPATGSEIFAASRPDEAADEDPGIIVIKGGTFELVADDDCFNATDFIDVRDGLFYAVSLSDDVFDSNGGMDISGGTILAYATGAGHEAFDVEPEATPMTYPSTNEHALAISGGTIFATGGKNSAWPTKVTTADGVKLYSLEDDDVSACSGKYLTLNSSPKVTAKLPVFPTSTGSVLATCPGFDGTSVSVGGTAPKSGSQNFHDLYITSSGGFILIVR